MPNTAVLERLRADRDDARNAAIALAEAEDFDPTADAYVQLENRAASLDGQIERLVRLHEAQTAADALDGRLSRSATRQDRETHIETRSIGEQFVASDVWGNYQFRGTSARFECEWTQERALPHTLASLGDALSIPIQDLTPREPMPSIVALTNVVNVSSNSIDYIVWNLTAGAAAIVAEKASKPELEWAPTVSSTSLDTIAGRTSFTRQLAEDAAAVVSFLNGELQREVTKKVEAEARAAITAATLPTVAGPSGSGMVGAVRAGASTVQAAGYNPNAFLVHPNDLVDMDIAVMSTAGTGPNQTNAYWGLTPVVDPGGTEGTVVVGDFKAGVQHFRRNSVSLYVTDSHGTHFAENILDALAEQRCKTIVSRPAALVEATAGT